MSRKHKTNGRPIHTNMLRPSPHDMVTLGMAVEERFIEVTKLYLQVRGEPTVPPSALNKDMFLWREMMIRHGKGDYRNTRDEELATRRIADWTYRIKCELTGKEYVAVEWID